MSFVKEIGYATLFALKRKSKKYVLAPNDGLLHFVRKTLLVSLSKSVTIPIVPLQIPFSIRELFKYITRNPCWIRTDGGRFVLSLNTDCTVSGFC